MTPPQVGVVKKEQLLFQASMYSGPLPDPEMLKKYDEIYPGFANRIVTQAEVQTAHRIELEKKVIGSDVVKSYMGIIFAFIIGMTGITGGIYLATIGLVGEGLGMSGATVAALAGTFLYGANSKRKIKEK
jgi:uncharacterized membrane protein